MLNGSDSDGHQTDSFHSEVLLDDFHIITLISPHFDNRNPELHLLSLSRKNIWIRDFFKQLHIVLDKLKRNGFKERDIYMLGDSLGACLILEFAAMNGKRYGGLFAYNGSLFNDDKNGTNYRGKLSNTPIILGYGHSDDHILVQEIKRSAAVFRKMGALVIEKILSTIAADNGAKRDSVSVPVNRQFLFNN